MLRNSWGRFLHSHELMPLLGFKPGAHLPVEGFAPVVVQDVMFMCEPANGLMDASTGRKVKSSRHRIRYLCKECGAWIPFGRAGQHVKGREHKRRAGRM
ncbi:MAG TPA: hypothetical protein VH593_17030 [Ktedonobacteraceae bacterium]|jgi:hypothetical protein